MEVKTRCLLWLFVLATSASISWSQSVKDVKFMEANIAGCFRQEFSYDLFVPGQDLKVDQGLEACQARCRAAADCEHFLYNSFTTMCRMADPTAVQIPASSVEIAGDAKCTVAAGADGAICRTELPRNGFPGENRQQTNEAWPGGVQPYSLECWPKAHIGGSMACRNVTVLDSTEKGWPGKCTGLVEKKSINGSDCELDCLQNPLCSSWQLSVYDSCWQGLGRSCFVRPNFNVKKAERLQHGEVRVLMDLTGWHVFGLYKVFDNAQGYFTQVTDAERACKHVCYSDIRCQYWSYAPNFGCWIEDASQEYRPNYPLTLEDASKKTDFALDAVAGEYIQHFCADDDSGDYMSGRAFASGLPACVKSGVRYDKPDMPLQIRTTESSAEACMARCKRVPGCVYFAFWPDGGCHVADKDAKQVEAENFQVVAGPVDCQAPTQHPESWDYQPTLAPPSHPAATRTDAVSWAQVVVGIHGLNLGLIDAPILAMLNTRYAKVSADIIGVHVKDIMESKAGTQGVVSLTRHDDITGGSKLVFWTYNQPTDSESVAELEMKLRTSTYVTAMKDATVAVLGPSHPAIEKGIMLTEPVVANTWHPLPTESVCNWWCRYWPPVVAALIAVCVVAVAGGWMYVQPQGRQRKTSRVATFEGEMEPLEGDASPREVQRTGPVANNYAGYRPQSPARKAGGQFTV